MKTDYSEHLISCRQAVERISREAMARRYVSATWEALKLARHALNLSAALRRI